MSLLVIHLALITLGFYLLLLLFFLFVYLFVCFIVCLFVLFFLCLFFFLAKQKKLPVLDITAFFFCIPTHAKKETRYIYFFNSTVSDIFPYIYKKKSTNIHIVYPSFRYLVFDLTICGI
jgi:hypothetical protein